MRDLQILILDLQGNQLGELDLTDSDDFALKLTKSIASINDLGRRNTSYSLDFDVPQTKNNNKLLAGLRFVSHTKEILGQKPCSIMVDGNQVDRGFLYPFESELDGMYKLNFKGLNNDWVEQLRDVELNELNWRDYKPPYARSVDATELFTSARFNVLNTQTSVTSDLVYPLLNRNNNGSALYKLPQLHLRSIIISMFEKIGYTVESEFINGANSDWIKGGVNYQDKYGNPYEHLGLSVDPAFQMKREQVDLLAQTAEISVTGITGTNDPNTWLASESIGNSGTPSVPIQKNVYRFPNSINTVITDDFSRFDSATSEFTVGLAGTYSLTFDFLYDWAWYEYSNNSWQYLSSTGLQGTLLTEPTFTWTVVKNNVSDSAIDGTILFQGSTAPINADIQTLNQNHIFAQGDKISVFLELNNDANAAALTPNDLENWRLRIKDGSTITFTPRADVQLGDVFRINSYIPEGIKCLTLLQDFKTMFNLYFDVDVNRKTVFIEPRDEFYTGVQEDITELIDLNTPPTINYLTSYKNEMVFQYANDSKDKYLTQWNKSNDKTYAQYKYLFQNQERFDKGQSILSTSLLSPTIQGKMNNFSNYPYITSLVKEEFLDSDNANKPVNKNYGARVFQLVRGNQFDTANVQRRFLASVQLVALMEDYANTPTLDDRKLTFIGTRGLVEDYYAKTLANIEDTAVVTLKLNLSLPAYNSWDLKKTYVITEPAELAGHYITDSITNFNVTKETPTTVSLVKYKDFSPVATQGGVGNVNVTTQTGTQPQQIMCIVGGIVVPCLSNTYQPLYRI